MDLYLIKFSKNLFVLLLFFTLFSANYILVFLSKAQAKLLNAS